jgi:hypothetical protein
MNRPTPTLKGGVRDEVHTLEGERLDFASPRGSTRHPVILMNAIFIIVRAITGLTSLSAFILLCLVVFMRDTAATAKQGAQVLGYTAKLFATAFTEGTAPKTEPWTIGAWQVLIGALSLAMFVSVFTPGSRWFLHGTGVLAALVMFGYARMIFTGASLELVCLPFLIVWFAYYAMCLFWRSKVATP